MFYCNNIYSMLERFIITYIDEWCKVASTRILPYQRLRKRLKMRLVVVVGAEGKNF